MRAKNKRVNKNTVRSVHISHRTTMFTVVAFKPVFTLALVRQFVIL